MNNNPHAPHYRRTGRTFRALLGALVKASEGERVIYECRDNPMAKWTFDKAMRICNDFGDFESPEPLVIKVGQGTVRFTRRLNDKEVAEVSRHYHLTQDLT